MARRAGAGGIILLAVVLGVVTAILIWNYMRKQEELSQRNWEPVVVAVVDIKPRTKITRDMVSLEKYPKTLIAENAQRKVDEVVDRTTQSAISAKAQVRSTDLVAPGQTPTLSFKVPEGMRAVAIGGDEVRFVGTSVQPGDHVDIIATYYDLRTKQDVTKMILQNVLVLAVNKGETDASGKQGAQSSMTLAVTPEQTELVKAAERSGTMSVSLRSVRDDTVVPTEGFSAKELAGTMQVETVATTTDTNEARQTPVIFIQPQATQRTQKDTEIKVYKGVDEKTVILSK